MRVEVEITDHVTVRGYAPVPIFEPQAATESSRTAVDRRRARLGGPQARRHARTAPPGWSPTPTPARSRPAGRVRIDGYDNAILERET